MGIEVELTERDSHGRVYVLVRGWPSPSLNPNNYYCIPQLTDPPLSPEKLKKVRTKAWLTSPACDGMTARGISLGLAKPDVVPLPLKSLDFTKPVVFLGTSGHMFLRSWLGPVPREATADDSNGQPVSSRQLEPAPPQVWLLFMGKDAIYLILFAVCCRMMCHCRHCPRQGLTHRVSYPTVAAPHFKRCASR